MCSWFQTSVCVTNAKARLLSNSLPLTPAEQLLPLMPKRSDTFSVFPADSLPPLDCAWILTSVSETLVSLVLTLEENLLHYLNIGFTFVSTCAPLWQHHTSPIHTSSTSFSTTVWKIMGLDFSNFWRLGKYGKEVYGKKYLSFLTIAHGLISEMSNV